jgi:hypothetical protein
MPVRRKCESKHKNMLLHFTRIFQAIPCFFVTVVVC